MKPLADSLRRLGTETAFETLARAKALEAQGKEIIHMEIGEPDFDTPNYIKQAAKDALDQSYTHYTPAAGIVPVRQTIADYIAETRAIPVKAENVVVVPGGKPIMFYTIMALVNPGDEVIYPNPGFPIYESMINFVGGVAGAAASARSARVQFRSGRVQKSGHTQDQVDHHQLARQSVRRRDEQSRRRRRRRDGAQARLLRALR